LAPSVTPTVTLQEGPEEAPPNIGASIGRFLVLEVIGMGGMGMVLSAFDPQLDRKVALKILRGAVDRREALLSEARAMARLQHPNVVAVHEVDTIDGVSLLVMEHVVGRTMRAWLAEEKRSWREIVQMFRGAGAGLSAAHRVGLVHRDIKPDNMLVGFDGRPRVADFGLAFHQEGGTAGYMPPEEVGDARADQFSFCVSLWEALHGAKPTPDPALPTDKRVPLRIDRALARGLSRRPEDRWSSMDELLSALQPHQQRPFWVAWVTAVVLAALAAFAVGKRGADVERCDGGDALIARTWDDPTRTRVRDAFRRTNAPYADATFRLVDRSLTTRTRNWATAHREACEATKVRHEQSDALLDLRMQCLRKAKAELGALVSAFASIDRTGLNRAAQEAALDDAVAACSDLEALTARRARPLDPQAAKIMVHLEDETARIDALDRLGRWKEAMVTGHALVATSRVVGDSASTGAALFTLGLTQLHLSDIDAALRSFYEAARFAGDAKDDLLLARIWSGAVFAHGVGRHRYGEAEAFYRVGLAALQRVGNPGRVLAQLYSDWASTLQDRGDFLDALPLRLLALIVRVKVGGERSFTVAVSLADIAATLDFLGRPGPATPFLREALSIAEEVLGPDHPVTATIVQNFGALLTNQRRHIEAAPYYQRALDLRLRVLGPDNPQVANSLIGLANTRVTEHRFAEARDLVGRARAIYQRSGHGRSDAEAMVLLGTIAQREGKLAEAHRLFQEAMVGMSKEGDESYDLIAVNRSDAEVLLGDGKISQARTAMDRALAIEKATAGADYSERMETLRVMGNLLLAERRGSEARTAFREAIRLGEKQFGAADPALGSVWIGLSEAQRATGDEPGALISAERAVVIAAGGDVELLVEAKLALAEAAWRTGDRGKALRVAQEARAALHGVTYPTIVRPRLEAWFRAHPSPR
jgi:eukaryotic-like serine/threonine-protein kinase